MATRTIPWTTWLKQIAKHARHGEFDGQADHLIGLPIIDVATKLKVARSRVYQLVEQGALEIVQVTTADDRVVAAFVTQKSLDRYLDERIPDRNRQGYFAFGQ